MLQVVAAPANTSRRPSSAVLSPIAEQRPLTAHGAAHRTSVGNAFASESRERIDRTFSVLSQESYADFCLLPPRQEKTHNLILFGTKKFKLEQLKTAALGKTKVKATRSLKNIVASKKFDVFVLAAAEYAKAHVKILHLEKIKSLQSLSVASEPKEFRLTDASEEEEEKQAQAQRQRQMSVAAHLFEREQSVESALDEKNEALQEFARTYCFLLLHVSQSGMEPAKERAYFEAIYAITKDLCATLISLPSYNSAIDMELNRLFRGNLFCGTDSSNKRAIIAAPPAANVNQPKPLRAAVTSAKQFFAAPAQPRLSILPPLPVPGGSDFTPKRSSVTFSTVTPPTLPSNLNNSLKFKRKVSIVGKLSAMTKPVPNAKLMEVLKIAEESVNREKEEEGESASVIRAASVVTPSVVRSTLDEKKNERRMSMYDAQAKKWALAALAGKGRKKILLSDIRMARSPLADAVLPPPQRFLFL